MSLRTFIALLLTPIAIWLVSIAALFMISSSTDCSFSSKGISPCIIYGIDIGHSLYDLGLMAAWGFLAVPYMWGYLFAGWFIFKVGTFLYGIFIRM